MFAAWAWRQLLADPGWAWSAGIGATGQTRRLMAGAGWGLFYTARLTQPVSSVAQMISSPSTRHAPLSVPQSFTPSHRRAMFVSLAATVLSFFRRQPAPTLQTADATWGSRIATRLFKAHVELQHIRSCPAQLPTAGAPMMSVSGCVHVKPATASHVAWFAAFRDAPAAFLHVPVRAGQYSPCFRQPNVAAVIVLGSQLPAFGHCASVTVTAPASAPASTSPVQRGIARGCGVWWIGGSTLVWLQGSAPNAAGNCNGSWPSEASLLCPVRALVDDDDGGRGSPGGGCTN